MMARGVVAGAVLLVSCAGANDARVVSQGSAPTAEPVETPAVSPTDGPPVTAPLPPGAYNLSQLPVLSKVLFYVVENYLDKRRLDFRQMALGALEFVQRDVPEILIDRSPAGGATQVTVTVGGRWRRFSLEGVNAPWNLRSTLQDIFRFVQPNLLPVPAGEEGKRLVEIEITAVNGMLYTLDPHSVLLDAETYKEMRTPLSKDAQGGVGLVLEMDAQDRITVKRPMADAPAFRSGIAPGDRIVKIGDAPTQNMTLVEAIERLRGSLDSTVDIYVERGGNRAVKKHTLTRGLVRATSIDPPARVLSVPAGGGVPAAKVGYFHLQHLAYGAAEEVKEGIRTFEKEGVKGMIMDLRDNHGGLYAEAYKVADAFIESGILVSMVGMGDARRKDETASETAPKAKMPLVVIVNHVTASGAEIVAAAIKNLDRGVVTGETTFGMGSVQVLFDVQSPRFAGPEPLDDKLGLKLTTAQFLAAGGAPIQGAGVVPDIQTDVMTVPAAGASRSIRLQPSRRSRREVDYERHLPSTSAVARERPFETISYLGRDGSALEVVEAVSPAEDDFVTDLAKQLLLQAKGSARRDLMADAPALLARLRAGEDGRLSAALKRVGVDWVGGTGGPPPSLQLSLQPVAGAARVTAGGTSRLRGVVKNVGSTTAYRVRAVLESDSPIFDENELVFGRIAPGESRTYDLSVEVPGQAFTQTDLVRGTLFTQYGVAPANVAETTLDIEGRPRPALAYRYQLIDDQEGSNNDGRVQRGEKIRIPVTVTNNGPGLASRLQATLRGPPTQRGIVIQAGRFETRDFAPGSTKTFTFVFSIRPDFAASQCDLALSVGDATLGEALTTAIKVGIATDDNPAGLRADGPVVNEATPPLLTVSAPAVATGNTVHVKGRAVDDHLVRDVYVRVWNRSAEIPVRKVFYQPNRFSGDRSSMDFELDVPIIRGNNLIQVFARESNEVQSLQTLVVLKH